MMRKIATFTFFGIIHFLFVANSLSAKESTIRYNHYSIGVGYGFNSNVGNDGIIVSSEYMYYLSRSLAINPALSFFQSINLFHDFEDGYKSHSGIVASVSLNYSLFRTRNVDWSFNIGPSIEIGDQTFTSLRVYTEGVLVEERFENERLLVPGVVGNINFSWDTDKEFVKTLSLVSNSQYGQIPNSLGIVYRIGF